MSIFDLELDSLSEYRFSQSSTEPESGNVPGVVLQTPAPVLDKFSGPMGAGTLSSIGLGSGNLIGNADFLPVPALDKNRSPTFPWKAQSSQDF